MLAAAAVLCLTSCNAVVGAGAVAVLGGVGVLASQCYDRVQVRVIDPATGGTTCDADVTVADADGSERAVRPCYNTALTDGHWRIIARRPGYVPASSEIQTMEDLVAKLKADPGSVSWGGGSAGGADHITAGLIAKAVGVDPTQVNYIAFSGGGEALAAILGGQVTVGVSGYGEFQSQVEAGALRVLAVSGEERMAGVDAPTLKEAGVDVALENWRMVAAAPEITDEEKAAITADIEKMAGSEAWKKALADHGWIDSFEAGDAFQAQLAADITATEGILKDIGLVQ